MKTPTIQRKLAVINGFVEIPNSRIQKKTSITVDEVLSAIPGTYRLNGSMGAINQDFVVFPDIDAYDMPQYQDDWFKTLNDLS